MKVTNIASGPRSLVAGRERILFDKGESRTVVLEGDDLERVRASTEFEIAEPKPVPAKRIALNDDKA